MFSTFSTGTPGGASSSPFHRPSKRPHAMRACMRCRQVRIKCDDSRPCRPCVAKGTSCRDEEPGARPKRTTLSSQPISSVSQDQGPLDEGIRLDLVSGPTHGEVPSSIVNISQSQRASSASTAHSQIDSSHPHQDSGKNNGHPVTEAPYQSVTSSKRFMEHLQATISQSNPNANCDVASMLLAPSPFPTSFAVPSSARATMPDAMYPNYMDRAKEERLITAFLQSYQIVVPILNPSWLWTHHASLWSDGAGSFRQSCPLIDILLALSVHQVVALSDDTEDSAQDAAEQGPPGYHLFESSQIALLRMTNAPDLLAVHSYLYASIYMGNLHQTYKAQQLLAVAVRNAFIMGLPVEHAELDYSGDHSAKMTWLTLQMLDTIMSKEAGMPYLITALGTTNIMSQTVNEPPKWMPSHEGLSHLACFAQLVQLSNLFRQCAVDFNRTCIEILSKNPAVDIFSIDDFYGIGASSLKAKMKAIHVWSRALPAALKTKPKQEQDMEFDPECETPMWLHRQRLLLRMAYHMASLMLLRPYACVAEKFERHNANAAELSVACSKHASALTTTVEENLDTGSFNVLSQATRFQWLASLCLTGYIITHPTSPHAPAARKSLATSIKNFERISRHHVPQAKDALRHTKHLGQMAQLVVEQSVAELSGSMGSSSSVPPPSSTVAMPPYGLEPLVPGWSVGLGDGWPWLLYADDSQEGIDLDASLLSGIHGPL